MSSPLFLLGLTTLAAVWALLRGRPALVGTTLLAPWCWALAAILAVAAAEFAAQGLDAAGAAQASRALRFAAAGTSCLPLMAVLGAKRPQDRGWQFIVATLWIVLALPCGQWWLLGGSRTFLPYPAWSWFLAAMLLMQLGNYLPTRYWPPAICITAAQVLLLWEWLPDVSVQASLADGSSHPWRSLAAMALTALACWSVVFGRAQSDTRAEPLDRVWREFRDQFGAVWALRILERVNSTARLSGWPLELDWRGFAASNGQPAAIPPDVRAAVTETLQTLLRRFVSAAWIQRLL